MKTWDQFLKDVLVHVPGCPEPTAEHAILRAAQEFIEATRVWKLWLDDVDTLADTTSYAIPLPTNSELVRLELATLDGRKVDVLAVDQLPEDWQTYPDQVSTCVHTSDRVNVILLPTPAADSVLKLHASVRPSDAATGIEDYLYDQYALQIAAGAVAALKEHAGKSYSDPNGALYWRDRFQRHIGVVDVLRFRGYSAARPRRRASFF